MSALTKEPIVQEQAKTKPKIEVIIAEYLDGESRQSLTDLMGYCKANGIKNSWSGTNRWQLKLNETNIGTIYIGHMPRQTGGKDLKKNIWYISFNMLDERFVEDVIEKDNLTDIIHKNVIRCIGCRKNCAPHYPVTILEKEFTGLCRFAGNLYANPNAETLCCIKKWLDYTVEKLSGNV